jgi:lipopolysaccharide/colanic/teichoic acid biosynthesis glycosyltransferase
MDRKLRRDLDYLKVRTPLSDARIVFETAAMVLRAFAGKQTVRAAR